MQRRRLQPVFRPIRLRFMPFNIPLDKMFGIIAAALAGLFLAVAGGGVTHQVEHRYTTQERAAVQADYRSTWAALCSVERQRGAEGAAGYEEMDLTASQRQTVETAARLGVDPYMTEDEVSALAPSSYSAEEPWLDAVPRFLILVGAPVLVGAVLFMEVNRTSLWDEIKRARAFERSQKRYPSQPAEYVERETCRRYLEAIVEAAGPPEGGARAGRGTACGQ